MIKRVLSFLPREFISGSFWILFGGGGSRLVLIVYTIFLTRLLGRTEFGNYSVILSTYTMATVFAGFGLNITASRYVAKLITGDTRACANAIKLFRVCGLVVGSTVSLVFYVSSDYIATAVLGESDFAFELKIIAPIFLLFSLDSVQTGTLFGLHEFRRPMIGLIVSSLIGYACAYWAASTWGSVGAVGGLVFTTGLVCISSYYFLKKVLNDRSLAADANWRGGHMGALKSFALPAMLSSLMVFPSHWFVHVKLIAEPAGRRELAILIIAMQWFQVVSYFPSMTGRILLPMFSGYQENRDGLSQKRKLLGAATATNFATAGVFVIVAALFSKEILSMYGPSFGGEQMSLLLAVFVGAMLAIESPAGQYVNSTGVIWLAFLMNAGWAVVYIGASLLLLGHGSVGVLSALGVAYFVHGLWTFGYVYMKLSKMKEA